MDFAAPERLWLLLSAPGLVLWIVRRRRRRARDWVALGKRTRPRSDGSWRWLVAAALLTLALAGPRWGRLPGSELPPGHDVVLLVDTSRSMGAQDAVPDRLGVAIECGEGLVAALGREPSGRAALVAFAGGGVLRCPLTENLGAVADALKRLRPGDVRPGGTDLGAALEAAVDAFDEREPAEGRTIVVLTDGEDHAGFWRRELPRLDAARVIVHAVAIGDPRQGHPVPVVRSAGPTGRGSLRYHGRTVLSKRIDAPLEALTRATGGALLRVGLTAIDLGPLYDARIAPIARQRRQAMRPPERVERYSAFVRAALVVGLAGSWPGRRRLSALALLAVIGAPGAGPRREQTAAEAIAAGDALYAAGDYSAALANFQRAMRLDEDSPIPRYNAAAALFQLGRYSQAEAQYREAHRRAGAGLRTKIDYALGNVAVALGEYSEAVRAYDSCLRSRVSGPIYAAVRRDAELNRAFAARQRPPSDDTDAGDRRSSPRQASQPIPKADAQGERSSSQSASPDQSEARNDRATTQSSPEQARGANRSQSAERPADSPEAQLEDALRNARQARERRLPEDSTSAPDEERKDW